MRLQMQRARIFETALRFTAPSPSQIPRFVGEGDEKVQADLLLRVSEREPYSLAGIGSGMWVASTERASMS